MGSREAASEGPAVLHICFYSLPNNSIQVAIRGTSTLAQTQQQYSMHGHMMVNL